MFTCLLFKIECIAFLDLCHNRWTPSTDDPLYPVASNDQMPLPHQPPLQNAPIFSHPIDTSISTNPSGSCNMTRNNIGKVIFY